MDQVSVSLSTKSDTNDSLNSQSLISTSVGDWVRSNGGATTSTSSSTSTGCSIYIDVQLRSSHCQQLIQYLNYVSISFQAMNAVITIGIELVKHLTIVFVPQMVMHQMSIKQRLSASTSVMSKIDPPIYSKFVLDIEPHGKLLSPPKPRSGHRPPMVNC